MDFMIAAHSDVGIKKHANQDALLIKTAQTNLGKVCLCVVCDGMGGLSNGELASATVIREMERWFEQQLPQNLQKGFDSEKMRLEWDNIVLEQNKKLAQYASARGLRMGTTITALLIADNKYYIMNVGDSRVYMISDRVTLLTKDQTFVQYEIDNGRMTLEEAAVHPQRNVLLQCVGASDSVIPDFFSGEVCLDTVFMLCSDGFRHVISDDEIYEKLNPYALSSERTMKENAVWLTELNKQRREPDNISVALVRTCQEV